MSNTTTEHRRRYREKKFFDNKREAVIQRDGEKCVNCGMTREEHKAKFGRDITVDHEDGNGRYSETANNDIANLQTLCLPCHGRKDGQRASVVKAGKTEVRLTLSKVVNIFHMRGAISQRKIAALYGISQANVTMIHKGHTWRHLALTDPQEQDKGEDR